VKELVLFVVFISAVLVVVYKRVLLKRKRHGLTFIKEFEFPKTIRDKIKDKYTHLTSSDLDKVELGLKEWFYVCNFAGKKAVSMPSQVVDVAWHEFILFTKCYHDFCEQAFGRFLHHNPAEAMQSDKSAQKGIKTAWKISCSRENISPKKPRKLPVLFGLDSRLKIPDGFKYSLNCDGPRSNGYCASHIGCSSVSSCSSSTSDDNSCGCSSSGCGGSD
jgi:hypothetical protein